VENLQNLEKKINSELNTKINSSIIKNNQIYLDIDNIDLIDVITFLKSNKDTKFKQLIDLTAVDYPENEKRFKMIYLLLSHEFNQRIILNFSIKENESVKFDF
jgi:NADH:ubiquinone oxidoreductase 27 kD subunit